MAATPADQVVELDRLHLLTRAEKAALAERKLIESWAPASRPAKLLDFEDD